MNTGLRIFMLLLVLLAGGAATVQAQEVLIESLYEKAQELYRMQRYDAVVPLVAELERVSNLELSGIGPRDEELLLRLAGEYEAKGQIDLSLTMYKSALDLAEDIHGAKSARVAEVLAKIADIYSLKGDIDIADIVYSRALDIRTNALGENHPDVLSLKNRLLRLREGEKR